MGFLGPKKIKFKCPVWVVDTLEQLARHADNSHGGRGREL